jgi:O-succinylbenzoic acid--CoA ligase
VFALVPGPARSGSGDTLVVAVIDSGPRLARAALACWEHGRAVMPVNPAFTRPELDALFERLRPNAILAGGEVFDYDGGERAAPGIAAIVVTSGTAGEPKGVELTVEGMEVMGHGYSKGLLAGPNDRWLMCLPLHHVASLGALARSFVTGVPYTVHEQFDIDAVATSPASEGTTMVSLVPTTLRRLLDANAPIQHFRRVIVGGAPCPPTLRSRAEVRGATIVDAYGLSETWSGFALDGMPIDGAEVQIAADGEILVRGAMVMHGYRLNPELTATVLEPDGWLHTGDVGGYDEAGRLRVVDRLKDIIITGGVNVSPTEVEAVLAHHPEIADVCVIGTPDEEWGERVVAVLVPRPDTYPTLDAVREFARDQLSPTKLPREIRVVDEIPRGGSGKPLRRVLRDPPQAGD